MIEQRFLTEDSQKPRSMFQTHSKLLERDGRRVTPTARKVNSMHQDFNKAKFYAGSVSNVQLHLFSLVFAGAVLSCL